MLENDAVSGLLEELEDSIGDLRRYLLGRVPAEKMLAPERHAIERSLDRYVAASDAIARHVDDLLRGATPRPRR